MEGTGMSTSTHNIAQSVCQRFLTHANQFFFFPCIALLAYIQIENIDQQQGLRTHSKEFNVNVGCVDVAVA